MSAPQSRPALPLETPGGFVLGCNYWASHAGTAMWRDWRPDVVADDFARLAAHGLTWIRIFPLWPDFQPIHLLRGGAGRPVEMRFGEDPLPDDATGQAGVSSEMLARLDTLCGHAERHGLRLIVGLVTGWMSGRLFVPPALEGRDPITDPVSLAWQIRFVRAVVRHARGQPAIAAWDLGNECNCMGMPSSREAAYAWTAAISQTIRAADPTRAVVSGMHSLGTPVGAVPNVWCIDDQADLTDILTTHPYPYWTRHTRVDAVTGFRTTLHATAETRFYADIGGRPCFAEEIGTMGPMIAGDRVSADFARTVLFSLWANDGRGFLWWCAHDQTHLPFAPYDWNGVELELGLFRTDGMPKPVTGEIAAFAAFLRGLPVPALPVRPVEGVCLLTHGQDDWAAAYGAFVLAKQARLEIAFRHIGQALPDAPLYLLPSLTGQNAVPRRRWLELIARVRAGATLYVSLGDGVVPFFSELSGVAVHRRAQAAGTPTAEFTQAPGIRLPLLGGDDLDLEATDAEVIATRTDTGAPAFWRRRVGQGWILVFAAPIETALASVPRAFDLAEAPPYRRVYDEIAALCPGRRRVVTLDHPHVALTEHPLPDGSRIIIAINHGEKPLDLPAPLTPGTTLAAVWRGAVQAAERGTGDLRVSLPAHDAAVFLVRTRPDGGR